MECLLKRVKSAFGFQTKSAAISSRFVSRLLIPPLTIRTVLVQGAALLPYETSLVRQQGLSIEESSPAPQRLAARKNPNTCFVTFSMYEIYTLLIRSCQYTKTPQANA
jgi:hypothetical protein